MKKLTFYILSVLFIFAILGRSIDYIVKTLKAESSSINKDFCCEEENKEEKKTEEESETDDIMDKLFTANESLINSIHDIHSTFFEKNNFYYSEYYKIIYSPPELI